MGLVSQHGQALTDIDLQIEAEGLLHALGATAFVILAERRARAEASGDVAKVDHCDKLRLYLDSLAGGPRRSRDAHGIRKPGAGKGSGPI